MVCVYICMCVHIFTYLYFLALREPRGNDTPVAMYIPSTQILVSKYHASPRLPAETAYPRVGTMKAADESEHLVLPESKEVLKE